jgi:uncharacterized protein with von Willebrand factor type A (vWA) domain
VASIIERLARSERAGAQGAPQIDEVELARMRGEFLAEVARHRAVAIAEGKLRELTPDDLDRLERQLDAAMASLEARRSRYDSSDRETMPLRSAGG